MQTLLFNTTTKTIIVYDGKRNEGTILFSLSSIPTVKPIDSGYYEVYQNDENGNRFPVLRLPISNTNMIIEQ